MRLFELEECRKSATKLIARARMLRPYSHAPRLPNPALPGARQTEPVEISSLVRGDAYEIEIGPGRGVFVFERLAYAKDAAMVGFEIKRKWATIVDERLKALGLGARGRVFAEDAKEALARLRPDGCVRAVFLHFPDPWWKKRHQKRLVMGDELLVEVHRLLHPQGALYIQTDVEERAQEYAAHIQAFRLAGAESSPFVADGDVPGDPNMAQNPYGAESPREKRANADGLPVHRLRYLKRAV
jgi:tRNA (guanine-N7-)-methyltransferase